MRFTNNGPSIPDALLNARDEGRVVFFCGAGVSRARALLPDFFGLAEAVIRELGVPEDSDAHKVLNKVWEIGDELSVSGLISADRVFGLLERDFTSADIQAAVAKSLAPKAKPDLSAHQLLLRLATTPDSKTQLVTTNFDRLFDECSHEPAVFQPPRLPNPSRYDDLNGVVYLHGRVNEDYTGADGNGFVLSSSDFGYAYLSEGWATEFFREIVRGYIVVFIGYSADDPPINYLLEGLRRIKDSSRRIYSFQAAESDEAIARWLHKGVEAIAYGVADKHRALWETLEHWAQRADDPVAWRKTTIELAMDGPEKLQPHQRGQLAHIVATYEGARDFADRTPPAEWLCVFDSSCRYAGPERRSEMADLEEAFVDPFALYALDSDVLPTMVDPNDHFATREAPLNAWDAFDLNSLDRQSLSDESFPSVRGHYATHMPRLPPRLERLGRWIADVANQPAAVWWAARQKSLHPGIRRGIEWGLGRFHEEITPVILEAWRYLLEARDRGDDDARRKWHDLKREIEHNGWSHLSARRFITINCPYLKVGPALMSKPAPPKKDTDIRLSDLVQLEVECPVAPNNANIPDEWLNYVIRGLRKNIEHAVRLCEEVDDMHRFHISPIVADNRPDISDYGRTHGLSGWVIQFARLFERLTKLDALEARREFLAWPTDDETAFSRLRIWVGGMPKLTTPHAFCQLVAGLSDEVFWNHYHQRDFLLVLAKRWRELPIKSLKKIEARLLNGPAKWEGEDDSTYDEHRAWAVVERLRWLANHRCEFSFDVEAEIDKRRRSVPKWKPEYATHAADSREMRGGWVATNTEHAVLLREPIESVLSKARELSGRSEDNTLEEHDPFAGLCAQRPARAYLALVHAARRNEFPVWAWEAFLASSARKEDKPRFSATVALRLCRFPDTPLQELLYTSTSWLQKSGRALSEKYPDVFDKVAERLIDVVYLDPSGARSALLDVRRHRDWATAALNSPVGHIAIAIFEDSRLEGLSVHADSSANWLTQLERLLGITGDPGRHAIAIVARNLGWLHKIAPEWTERHLLSVIDGDDLDDQAALWGGYFWNPKVTSVELFVRLKPALLALAKGRDSSSEGYVQSLASLILWGWVSTVDGKEERIVSNDEFREALLHGGDDFRSHVLYQLERMLDAEERTGLDERVSQSQGLFSDVWPRQRSVKNPTMSTRLIEFLVSNVETFSRFGGVVLPLLTKIDHGHDLYFRAEVGEIIASHPELFLSILYAVLPGEATNWPYGIGDVLEKLDDEKSGLLTDARLQELKRTWSAR